MEITLSLEEKKIIDNFCSLGSMHVTDNRFNDDKIRESLIQMISINIIASYLDSSPSSYKKALALYKAGEDHIVFFSIGLSIALVVGYLQSVNNDVNLEEFPEFGYKDLAESVQGALLLNMGIIEELNSIESSICNGLNVKIRDNKDVKSYFNEGLFHDDIKLLGKILTVDIDDGYNIEMKKALKSNGDISGALNGYMTDLKAVYNLVFCEGFGTKPYEGVLFDNSSFYTIVNDSSGEKAFTATRINNGKLTLAKLASRLYDKASKEVVFSTKRQFDYDTIFESESPVYHPYKILEYAMGRESTLNMSSNRYKASAYSVSWESYSSNYVFPNLEEILLRGYYKAFEKVLKDKNKIKEDFVSQSFIAENRDYEKFLDDNLTVDVYSCMEKYISRLVASMECMYILTSYPYLANQIIAINIRVTSKIGSLNFTNTDSMQIELFRDLIATNKKEDFNKVINISDGRTSASGKNLAVNIYEYQFDANPLIRKAEPLFGYTVQQLNQKKGVECDWKNILLGETREGKELYASASSDVPLQRKFIHNIYAGSRAGKGLMTMNILANALVAGKPVFYLDRKPDMANMLYSISKGKQFLVNGKNYVPSHDIGGFFNEYSGEALSSWRETKPWLESHTEILSLFGATDASYYGALGDVYYLRAFMFALGMCFIRSQLSGVDNKLRESMFNGDDGIVIVVDELTGFQNDINSIVSTISSRLVQKALQLGGTDELLNKKKDLERKIEIASLKKMEAKKDSAVQQQVNDIAKLQEQIDNLFDTAAIYASTFFSKITSSFRRTITESRAGFKSKEYLYSDIFVLGQDLGARYFTTSLGKPLDPAVFFPIKADGKDYYDQVKQGDIIRSFLEEFKNEDWFFGRETNKYGDYYKDEDISAWRAAGNWDFVTSEVNNENTACEEVDAMGSGKFPMKHTLFKAYLVLNNNLENNPPKDGGANGEYQYVANCAARVDNDSGCEGLWETIRLKHIRKSDRDKVTPDNKLYNHLEEGLGFKGLIKETLLTTEEGRKVVDNLDDYIINSLAKSGEIADYVAEKMGYPNGWQSLIYDLSPRGLFSFEDMVNAVVRPDEYTLENRFPLYAKLGLLDLVSDEVYKGATPSNNDITASTIMQNYSNETFTQPENNLTDEEIDNNFRDMSINESSNEIPSQNINDYANYFYGNDDIDNNEYENEYYEDSFKDYSQDNNDGYNDGYSKGYDDACRSFANFYIDTSGLSFPNRQEAFDFIYNYLKSKEV